jgi:hypothetical protein
MHSAITNELAKELVRDLMAEHAIAISDNSIMARIANYLTAASEDENFSVTAVRSQNARHERGCERVKLIETLLNSYTVEKEEHEQSDAAARSNLRVLCEKASRDKSIDEILSDLESLQATERELCKSLPASPLPNKRPPLGKNVAASQIFDILREINIVGEDGIGTWDASELISEMLIRAGISKGPLKMAQRALYDKLKRIEKRPLRLGATLIIRGHT